MIPRWLQVVCLAVVVAVVMTESVTLGLAVAGGFIGAYGLGAESSTSPPDAEDLEEWSA